jgi:hypothetical protein
MVLVAADDGDDASAQCVVVVMVMASFSSSSCFDGVKVLMEIWILELWRLWRRHGGRAPAWMSMEGIPPPLAPDFFI